MEPIGKQLLKKKNAEAHGSRVARSSTGPHKCLILAHYPRTNSLLEDNLNLN